MNSKVSMFAALMYVYTEEEILNKTYQIYTHNQEPTEVTMAGTESTLPLSHIMQEAKDKSAKATAHGVPMAKPSDCR